MSNEYDLSARLQKCGVTYGQIVEARNNIFDRVYEFARQKWPSISEDLIWQNLSVLDHLHRCHLGCATCMSVEMCPSRDGTRTVGRMAPNGFIEITQERCPHGYKLPKRQEQDGDLAAPRWRKKGA